MKSELPLPRSVQRAMRFDNGEAVGISNRWRGGQYCTILTQAGLVGCGIYDIATAAHFNQPHIRATVGYGLHGRVGGLPARLAGYGERWDGDECVLWAEGEVLQSAVFGEQLVLRRRI